LILDYIEDVLAKFSSSYEINLDPKFGIFSTNILFKLNDEDREKAFLNIENALGKRKIFKVEKTGYFLNFYFKEQIQTNLLGTFFYINYDIDNRISFVLNALEARGAKIPKTLYTNGFEGLFKSIFINEDKKSIMEEFYKIDTNTNYNDFSKEKLNTFYYLLRTILTKGIK
jgi:hypothetical protein